MDRSGWRPADRRRDAVSWSAEIVALAVMVTVLLLIFGILLGRSAAYLLAGAGWTFPERAALFTGLPGILAGDPAAGLDQPPTLTPARWLLASSVVAAELVLVSLEAVVGRFCWLRWGSGRLPGTATRAEVAPLLGIARLRRSARVIRPDLYSRRGR